MGDRIVVLVDMDCFYCQVEAKHNPSLKGKPMAVVQYNQWQGGGIIAVNYEARAFGVTRHIRGNEAKKKCPDIALVHVPSIRGKADLTRYRDAGREVVDVFCRFSNIVQRASVDEAYLDITQAVNKRHKKLNGSVIKPEQLPNTFVVGCSSNSNDEDERIKGMTSWLNGIFGSELPDEGSEKLAVAAWIVEEMRASVYKATGYHCSAGIAHNKILAKLACGLHKPQRQTILSQSGVAILYRTLPVQSIRGLGGKFGDIIKQRLNVKFMGDLIQFSESQLQKAFDEKSGSWLYNIARGIDDEPVTSRLTSKSIGCCKKFPGKLALATKETVEHWLRELAEEVAERLEKELTEGNRRATQFVVSYMQTIDGRDVSSSRCGPLTSLEPKQIVLEAMELLKKSNSAPPNTSSWAPPLKFLGLSAGKFAEKDTKNTTIQSFFKSASKKENSSHSETKPNGEDICDEEEIKYKDESSIYDEILDNNEAKKLENDESSKLTDESCNEEYKNEKNMKSKNGDLRTPDNTIDTFVKAKRRESTPKTPKNETNTDTTVDSNSAYQKSFFIHFFKMEGLIKTPTIIKNSKMFGINERNENNKLNEGHKAPTGPTGRSQEPTTSEGYRGIADRSIRLLQVDDSSNDSGKSIHHWVSPGEIFPNLDEVDDDVAALLPSPMQRQLRSRLMRHKGKSSSKKNKGISKSKTKKCLMYEDQSAVDVTKLSTKKVEDKNLLENNTNNNSLKNKTKKCLKYDQPTVDVTKLNTEHVVDKKLLQVNVENKSLNHDVKMNNINNDDNDDDAEKLPSNLSLVDIFASDSPSSLDDNGEDKEYSHEPNKTNNSEALNHIEEHALNDVVKNVIEKPAVKIQPLIEVISDGDSENSHADKAINIDESLKELCPHCNQFVPLMEYPEHLDFHVAADLDRELNRAMTIPIIKNGTLPSGNSPKKDNKRKKRGKAGEKKASSSDKKMRSITNFFAPVR